MATQPAARCIQHAPYGELEPDNLVMSEDCLYLNVWTPNLSSGATLPVIFWIHGGEFFAGSGTEARYNGAKLAARGAVVVTINHRLGVFGFLSHPELCTESGRKTSGNFGLLDQIASLQWVRENISAFGGNPHCITIAGESAGSCSVSALMASPLAWDLFHRALGESCAYFMPEPHAMRPLAYEENAQRGVHFMRAAGARSLAELRSMTGRQLLDTWLKNPAERFQPCIDADVLPNVEDVFSAGQQASVPLLAGWNGEEMGFLRATRDKFDSGLFSESVKRSFGDDAATLLSAYRSIDALESAVALASDRSMVYPTWKWAELHADHAPVFVYQFDRTPPGSPFGSTHACELEYVFGTLDSKPRDYLREDRDLSERMGDYWVNFARTGDPNGNNLQNWPAYGPNKTIIRLDSVISNTPLPSRPRLELLDRIYKERKSTRAG
jgi:para-nitrobenzyl esterase